MKIAFVIDRVWNPRAGTENQLLKLIRGLGPRHEVHLVCLRSTDWLERERQSLPCQVHVMDIHRFRNLIQIGNYRNLFRLIRLFRATRPDVVHTFFPVSNIVGVLCARAAGVRSIVASRRDYGEWMSRRYLLATRLANLFVTRIIANSERVKQLTAEVERVPPERVQVIANGIDVAAFDRRSPNAGLRSRLGLAPDCKVVGLVANYRPMKRHSTFLRAAKRISQARDDIHFVLVGDNAAPGDPKRAIQEMAASLGLADKVHFAHADGDVLDFLSLFDVGVNCSQGEGLSNAVMEYMATGVPCVVSDSGGNPDLISDGVIGCLFPLDDDHALAERVIRLIDHPEFGAQLASRAREKILHEMSTEAMVDKFEDCYRRLCGQESSDHVHSATRTDS